eukprot:1233592-Pleurochrysis_carterae.AAC.1
MQPVDTSLLGEYARWRQCAHVCCAGPVASGHCWSSGPRPSSVASRVLALAVPCLDCSTSRSVVS